MRPLRLLAPIAVIVGSLLLAPSARSTEPPVRSGRIVSGVLTTSPSWECRLVPDCLAWLAGACDPALAERDPAWLASIVDVGSMADGVTQRTFWYGSAWPAGFHPGGVTVEFWTAVCTKVEGQKLRGPNHTYRTTIAPRAVWMTVTANDNVNATWTLS